MKPTLFGEDLANLDTTYVLATYEALERILPWRCNDSFDPKDPGGLDVHRGCRCEGRGWLYPNALIGFSASAIRDIWRAMGIWE